MLLNIEIVKAIGHFGQSLQWQRIGQRIAGRWATQSLAHQLRLEEEQTDGTLTKEKHLLVSRRRIQLIFVCVEVLRSNQPNGVMSSAVS